MLDTDLRRWTVMLALTVFVAVTLYRGGLQETMIAVAALALYILVCISYLIIWTTSGKNIPHVHYALASLICIEVLAVALDGVAAYHMLSR